MNKKFLKQGSSLVYFALLFVAILVVFFLYKNILIKVAGNIKQTVASQKHNNSANCQIYFNPEQISVAKDADFTVDIMIDPASHNVSNADLIFTYDKTKLRLDSISQSKYFPQVLQTKISENGSVNYSSTSNFGSNISSASVYATLHLHALEQTDVTQIVIDAKKSGVYADDDPGKNELSEIKTTTITIKK